MAHGVIGRDDERDAIHAFLAKVEDGPRALVLSGEAGIGKTILWEDAADSAEERGWRVLSHRSVEAEASLSFTGLSDLLDPVFDEAAPTLAPLRRRALEVALLLAEPGEHAPDPRAIGLALLDVLRGIAAEGPVIVALDDAQWLDTSSSAVLQIALRRLREERVGLLVTIRGQAAEGSFDPETFLSAEQLTRLSIGPLKLAALHKLLRERIGLDVTRPELARLQDASAGNPFLALELGRELARTHARPEPGRALPVPESLHELLDGRLARLPTETGDVVLFAAALARPTVEVVATAHGDRQGVLEALDSAVRAGVVELDDDTRIRFTHPLLASACYEEAPLRKRRAMHRALARVVPDVEERARHLALAAEGPDEAVATELDAAASEAAGRGAPAAAAELAELAAELTEADPMAVRRRRQQAARFHRLAGDVDRAVELLESLLPETPPGVERADVLFELILTQRAGTPALMAYYDQARVEAAGDDARLARILAWQMGVHLYLADGRAAVDDARAALELAERTGDPPLLAVTIARVGMAEAYAVDITPGLLERGVEIEEREGLSLESDESPRYAFARLLARRTEAEEARTIFEEIEARAVERGDEGTRIMVLWPLSSLEWSVGRLAEAYGRAMAAYELTVQTQHPRGLAWVGRAKALIEADLGLVDEARASAAEGLAFSETTSKSFFAITTLGALGRLELALGNLEAAGDYLRELPAQLAAGGLNDPSLPVWADTIETLVLLGELKTARTYLEHYEEQAAKLGGEWALGAAARCRGLVAAGEEDLAFALSTFEDAVGRPDAVALPFERARTLLCLGAVRRQAQQKKPAREALEQALATFEELGARLWAEKARAELARISGRRAASDELTETEHRVAVLAAEGKTNKAIAAALYMGASTVEAHLSRTYRKLGIRSRAGLQGALTTVDATAANTRDKRPQP